MSTDRNSIDNENLYESASLEQENPFRNIHYTQTESETEQESALQSNQMLYESQPENPFVQPEVMNSEQYEKEQSEYELQLDKEDEFEVFSNFVHDAEFEQLITDLVSEAEPKFVNYLKLDTPNLAELEQALKLPDIENKFDQFFAMNYDPLVNRINSEIERFSSYLSESLHPEMDFETAQEVIDRFQINEPEQFFGKIGGFIKKVGKAALNATSRVGSFAAKAITTPFNLLLKPLLSKIGQFIKPFLKKVLSIGLRYIPPQYRSLAQSAAAALGADEISEFETSEREAFESLEAIPLGETLVEPEDENEGFSTGTETELFDQEYDVPEIVREFDRQIFEMSNETLESLPSLEGFEYESSPVSQFASYENEALILDDARNRFINGLISEPHPDIQRLTQEFIPALIPILKGAITIIGRDKVVDFIASYAAKLLNPLVGQQLSTPLSKVVTDVGLRLMALEVPEHVPGKELMAQMIVNTIGETVERVSDLPQAILEGEDEVLQSFIHKSMVESIKNNIPDVGLNRQAIMSRNIPIGVNWVHKDKGRYKSLSRVHKMTLDPNTAQRIKTWRHGETLYDVLRKYQGWNGKTPVSVTIHVFEPVIGTRFTNIASRHLGGSGPEYIRQILPLTKTAATLLLKDPTIAIRRRKRSLEKGRRFKSPWKRFYYVKITPSTEQARTPTTGMGKAILRSNDINIRFINPANLEARIYLNEDTVGTIRNATKNVTHLLESVEGLMLSNGSRTLQNLFVQLKIPIHMTKEIVHLLVGLILKNLQKSAGELASQFSQVQETREGVTIILTLGFPNNFLSNLPRDKMSSIGGSISKLFALPPSLKISIVPNYKI
jgi:hypothetical protein